MTEPTAGGRPRAWLVPAAVVGGVALVAVAFYLEIYRSKSLAAPIGWDTSRYLWRTTLTRAVGIGHLQQAVPPPVTPDQSRPGFPILASILLALTHTSPFRIAAVLPAVAAAVAGLAAGAFVSALTRRPLWELAVIALGVATSSFMVRLLGPETYQDNLLAAGVFMAAALFTGLAVRDRWAVVPAALLFGMGGVIHWAFFVFVGATLAIAAVLYVPASWRAWRDDTSLLDTPVARIGGVALGGSVLAGLGIFGLLGGTTRPPHLSTSEFQKKLRADVPKYAFRFTLPAAAVGVAALASSWWRKHRSPSAERSGTGFVLIFLVSWSLVVLAGYLAFTVAGIHRLPAHRFLAFALSIPILGAIGLLWICRLVGGTFPGRAGAVVACVLALVGVAFSARLAHEEWIKVKPWIDPAKIAQVRTLDAYLASAGVGTDRPIVLIVQDVDSSYTALMGHMARAALPAERIQRLYLFAGSADDYLARRPTPGKGGGPNAISTRYFGSLGPTYAKDPVAVIMEDFAGVRYRDWVADHPETVVAPGIAVVRGPVHPGVAEVPSPLARPMPPVALGFLAGAVFAVLWVAGLGWTMSVSRNRLDLAQALAVSPAVGIAALVGGGIVLDRLGLRLNALGGLVAAIAVAGAGFAWWWWSGRGDRRPSPVGHRP